MQQSLMHGLCYMQAVHTVTALCKKQRHSVLPVAGRGHHSGLLISRATSLPSVAGPINTGTPAAGPQFAELGGPRVPRMPGNKRSKSKVCGCPSLHGGREDAWLQEPQRKRRRCQTRGAIIHVVQVADGVEPMEAGPPEDQDELIEVDSPPA